MWKPEHRAAADRRGLRYESDLTDAEWALVGSLIPPAKRGGRPRTVNVREVLNAIFYVLWTGCQRAFGKHSWQEGAWPQAPHPDRYARPAAGRQRAFGKHPRSRRCRGSAAGGTTQLPVH